MACSFCGRGDGFGGCTCTNGTGDCLGTEAGVCGRLCGCFGFGFFCCCGCGTGTETAGGFEGGVGRVVAAIGCGWSRGGAVGGGRGGAAE